jgi:membrane-associated phospholipid phosphatase
MPGSLATRVTYLLEPKNWLIVTVVGVGAHADGLAGAGWGLLAVLGAPALLTGYLAFMLASVAALAAITLVWKISIHCAVAAGSVTVLALVYGPLVLGGYLLVGLLGWSRVAVRDHTVLQVVAGSVLGAAAAALAYAALR